MNSPTPWILDSQADARSPIGKKAAHLVFLRSLGFRVPAWASVSAEFLAALPEDASALGPDFAEGARATIARHGWAGKRLAVRSSADLEDTDGSSFAGMYETELNVRPEDLEAAVLRVWRSSRSERVKLYLRERGIGEAKARMSVLVQVMVEPEAAGVAFGMNPLTADPDERVIASVYGLGEGLVSGDLDSDQFFVRGGAIRAEIATKTHAFRPKPEGGVEKREVSADRRERPSLAETQVRELAGALEMLARETGKAQDVEFASAGGTIWYLQARPVTTQAKGPITYWDNSNLIESYPGLTTPLTYSFVRKTYQRGYMQLCEMIGVDSALVRAYEPVFGRMIGLIRNRMYYHLGNIAAVIRLLPGSGVLQRAFENAIGIEKDTDSIARLPPVPRHGPLSILRIVGRLVGLYRDLPRSREEFNRSLDRVLAEGRRRTQKAGASTDELFALYRDLETEVFGMWRAPIVNGLFTMVFFLILKKLTARWRVNRDRPNLHNDLLVGQESIVSTEPILWIFRLSTAIREDPVTAELFRAQEASAIWRELGRDARFAALHADIEAYLDKYGERCVGGELKLENPSYREEPELFVQILKSYLVQNVRLSFDQEKNQEIRREAERELARVLRGHPLRRWIYGRVLRTCREMVVWRENLRFKRTQAFGLVKAIFVRIGERLEAEGVLADRRDRFYLTQEEVFDYRAIPAAELRARAERRRAERLANEKVTLPARVRTRGEGEEIEILPFETAKKGASRDGFRGVGCSSGQVRGKVRVVRDPEHVDSLYGNILVAESTDPGWVKLFPTAAAVLLERGSLLSHTGIVTREMGIPCIVGIKGLLASVSDGDVVEMDGATGEVKVVERANPPVNAAEETQS